MKWFQHLSTAHTDFALREIIEEFDGEGYGFYWLCIELVAQQGKNYRLKGSKGWKKQLALILHIDTKKSETILNKLAELNLINKLALNKGDLFIPKIKRYSDDWSKRLQSTTEKLSSTTEKLRPDNTTLNKITKEESVSSFKKRKPYFNGEEMRKYQEKWWVVPKDGSAWLEFAGKESDIKWL